jgi:hypothetical protein
MATTVAAPTAVAAPTSTTVAAPTTTTVATPTAVAAPAPVVVPSRHSAPWSSKILLLLLLLLVLLLLLLCHCMWPLMPDWCHIPPAAAPFAVTHVLHLHWLWLRLWLHMRWRRLLILHHTVPCAQVQAGSCKAAQLMPEARSIAVAKKCCQCGSWAVQGRTHACGGPRVGVNAGRADRPRQG